MDYPMISPGTPCCFSQVQMQQMHLHHHSPSPLPSSPATSFRIWWQRDALLWHLWTRRERQGGNFWWSELLVWLLPIWSCTRVCLFTATTFSKWRKLSRSQGTHVTFRISSQPCSCIMLRMGAMNISISRPWLLLYCTDSVFRNFKCGSPLFKSQRTYEDQGTFPWNKSFCVLMANLHPSDHIILWFHSNLISKIRLKKYS